MTGTVQTQKMFFAMGTVNTITVFEEADEALSAAKGCMKELGITEEAEDFFISRIPELALEGTDCAFDPDDNLILWFSADDEVKCMQKIQDLIEAHISSQSQMQYTVKITSDLSW
ncbi:MAG: hypothetical protein Q4A05_11395 [Ruminococcus sp.]|nr:hypothetical protein [Ruminococcus sp.]